MPATTPASYGVNVSLEISGSSAAMERDLRLAEEMGFTWVRQRFPWAQIEPEPGALEWQRWDVLVNEVRRQGLTLIAVVLAPPAWPTVARSRTTASASPFSCHLNSAPAGI